MKTLIIATIAMLGVPAVSFAQSANGHVNDDYVGLSFVDYDHYDGTKLDGRNTIFRRGKIVYSFEDISDADLSTLNVGLRYTLGNNRRVAVSATAGVDYRDYSSGSDTELYLMGDIEFGIAHAGVLHAKLLFINSDTRLGAGYTHYFGRNFGLRGEAMFGDNDSLSLGVLYAF